MNWPNNVVKFALAIKTAEGSNPDWNNPGDLTGADAGAYKTCGIANSEGVLKFANAEDGWNALCFKINRMLSGKSSVYTHDMTLQAVGMKYSHNDPNWSKNVAAALGVPETITLSELADADL